MTLAYEKKTPCQSDVAWLLLVSSTKSVGNENGHASFWDCRGQFVRRAFVAPRHFGTWRTRETSKKVWVWVWGWRTEHRWLALGKVNKDYGSMAVCVFGSQDQIIFHILDMEKSNTVGAFFFPSQVWKCESPATTSTSNGNLELCRNKIKRGPMESGFPKSQVLSIFLKQHICKGSMSGAITSFLDPHFDEVDLLAGCFLPECAKEAPSFTPGVCVLWLIEWQAYFWEVTFLSGLPRTLLHITM